ncbi:MAG TPA: hypothetical protein VKQ52_20735, partial [Puia sp.]|nr:hypothetical protein [Puia sp.]
ELLNLQQLLNSSELEAPSLRFTRNVMEEIARYHVAPATKSYVNKNVIRGIGAFFLVMILGMMTWLFSQFKWTSGSGSGSGGSSFSLPIDKLGLNRLDNETVSKAFNGTTITLFMLVTVVLGFILLDMYLQQKKQSRIS